MAQSYNERVNRVKENIGTFPDFPKKGIIFRDIFPLMQNSVVFGDCIALLVEHIKKCHSQVEVIVGLDARGFIFGPLIAQQLGIAFVPIRKKGKLPGETISTTYSLEYGSDTFEMQKDSIKPSQKIIIVDDLLATGGTMSAACCLVKEAKGDILECMVVIELDGLKGRDKVPAKMFSLLAYEGE